MKETRAITLRQVVSAKIVPGKPGLMVPPINLVCLLDLIQEEIDLTLSREAISSVITIKIFNLPTTPYMP